jgi:diguanylate cyclase (GGDEF)-like protein/PAS domain S-box-containing protein
VDCSTDSESDPRIAAVVFEVSVGLMVTDARGVIERVNTAFSAITGYSREEALGRTPAMLSSGRHDAAFYQDMWAALREHGEWEGEIWNRRKNGEIYPEQLHIRAVYSGAAEARELTHYVAELTDITLRKQATEEIRSLAFYDPLTRLPNRRLLQDRLRQALAALARSNHVGALMFIDLDNFKQLNDTLGHNIGDLLLQQVAQRIQACVRAHDTVARLGGDEFVVILEDLSRAPLAAAGQAEVVATKILGALNLPYRLGQHACHSTPSIGITLFSDPLRDPDELLIQADIAMYQAKSGGRNAMRFFDQQMQDSVNARAEMEEQLRRALDLHQLRLYYQVQVDRQGRPLGAEALLRWPKPQGEGGGFVPPAEFIPLAEETGLILPIGAFVLEQACAQLAAWRGDPLMGGLVVAINVSARQFHQSGFADEVEQALRRHDVPRGLLKLELTESILVEHISDTIATMERLKQQGIRFSLDDFGTGYSSLQYLKQLPLDQLKIDQSFVRDLATDSSDQAIVSTIAGMARSLGLDVIAEGVESETQSSLLYAVGCHHYQGYLYGRPLPLAEFEQLVARQAALPRTQASAPVQLTPVPTPY